MSKIIGAQVIIRDNFNSVLVIQRKVKKTEPKLWDIFSRTLKGKETTEKCANRTIKEDLKTIIFDLEPFREYIVNEETGDTVMVYMGYVKERIVCHDNIVANKWISKKNISEYEFTPMAKNILTDFFESNK
ncbi:hypothetical protein SAMN02745163_00059 [Clostridium cavendishii DSM 21758]|uniref:Uncharacterized protein n=1 Tax=Clostridium cavendishii DSM 21758 TaxID=1121302 RepID=A0A1M6AE47_9CLOT|nr:NUDIX domain-containing protein [Clostridium cavendishii]SHI34692.1 hypothetical protein SAMN02745163_00059 [Clostridium cavendishii DSM 21758]